MEDNLKPCPFCGGKAALIKGWCELDNYVMCLECRNRTKPFNTKETAIKKWNTRNPMEEILKQLEETKNIAREKFENCILDACYQQAQLEQRTIDILSEVIELIKNGGK